MDDDPGMRLLRSRYGMVAELARALGISRQAVWKWRRVPAELLPRVEFATGIPRYLLRPDICPPPQTRTARRAGI